MTYDAAPAGPAPGVRYAPHPSMQQESKPRRTFALLAIVLSALELVLGLASVAVQIMLITADAHSLLMTMSVASQAISTVLALLAIVFAVLSIMRREPARVLAGIAIGISVASLVAMLAAAINYAVLASL